MEMVQAGTGCCGTPKLGIIIDQCSHATPHAWWCFPRVLASTVSWLSVSHALPVVVGSFFRPTHSPLVNRTMGWVLSLHRTDLPSEMHINAREFSANSLQILVKFSPNVATKPQCLRTCLRIFFQTHHSASNPVPCLPLAVLVKHNDIKWLIFPVLVKHIDIHSACFLESQLHHPQMQSLLSNFTCLNYGTACCHLTPFVFLISCPLGEIVANAVSPPPTTSFP